MDGFTYEQTAGGWHVCDICGVRVSHELKHQTWHRTLGAELDWAYARIEELEGADD